MSKLKKKKLTENLIQYNYNGTYYKLQILHWLSEGLYRVNSLPNGLNPRTSFYGSGGTEYQGTSFEDMVEAIKTIEPGVYVPCLDRLK